MHKSTARTAALLAVAVFLAFLPVRLAVFYPGQRVAIVPDWRLGASAGVLLALTVAWFWDGKSLFSRAVGSGMSAPWSP